MCDTILLKEKIFAIAAASVVFILIGILTVIAYNVGYSNGQEDLKKKIKIERHGLIEGQWNDGKFDLDIELGDK